MNLGQLEVLVAIVNSGSLSESPEVVSLTQSAVSFSLSRLEAELGVTLLERGRQGVALGGISKERFKGNPDAPQFQIPVSEILTNGA